MSTVRKALVALGGALVALAAALADGVVDSTEAITIAIGFATALGVYSVPNGPPGVH